MGVVESIERVDGLMVRLIGEAMLANAYHQALREDPRLERGYRKLADRHAANAARLGEQITARLQT